MRKQTYLYGLGMSAAKKLVTGGYRVGERTMVFVFEADSEEEVRQMLDELPLSQVAKPDIRQMQALGEMHAFNQFQ
jgi:muconolactone delta-isomerase